MTHDIVWGGSNNVSGPRADLEIEEQEPNEEEEMAEEEIAHQQGELEYLAAMDDEEEEGEEEDEVEFVGVRRPNGVFIPVVPLVDPSLLNNDIMADEVMMPRFMRGFENIANFRDHIMPMEQRIMYNRIMDFQFPIDEVRHFGAFNLSVAEIQYVISAYEQLRNDIHRLIGELPTRMSDMSQEEYELFESLIEATWNLNFHYNTRAVNDRVQNRN